MSAVSQWTITYKQQGKEKRTFSFSDSKPDVEGDFLTKNALAKKKEEMFGPGDITREQAEQLFAILDEELIPLTSEEKELGNIPGIYGGGEWTEQTFETAQRLMRWLTSVAQQNGYVCNITTKSYETPAFMCLPKHTHHQVNAMISHPSWKEKFLSIVFSPDIEPMHEVLYPRELFHPLHSHVWEGEFSDGMTRDIPLNPENFAQWVSEIQVVEEQP